MRAKFLYAALAITLLTFVAFGPICNSYFVSDDSEALIKADKIISSPRLFLDFFISSGLDLHRVYRPLQYALFSLTYFFAGTEPFIFHLTNILVHILASCLIYALVLSLLKPPELKGATTAFLASALFAVHPVHHEPVIWISAIGYPLVALFCLVSTIAYITYDRRGGWKCLILSLASFMCALGTSESAVSLPAVIALYQIIWGGEAHECRARRWRGMAPLILYFSILALYVVFRKYIFGTTEIVQDGYSVKVYATKNVLNDFVMLFNPLSNPRRYYFNHAWKGALLSLAIIPTGFFIAFIKSRTSLLRLILFGLLWSAISIAALYANFGMAAFPPRFLYLASIGLCIALAASVDAIICSWNSLRWWRIAYAGGTCVMITLCVVGLLSYVSDWAECSRITVSISEQLRTIFLKLEPGERFVLLNTQYNVWAAYVYNRYGPKFFMEPPLYPGHCAERVIALNVSQFPGDLDVLRQVCASGIAARYYCWCETSMKMVELPVEFVDDIIRRGTRDTSEIVERYCHQQ